MQTTTPTTTTQEKQNKVDFGNGRYSPLMRECFNDLKRLFGLPDITAARIANDIGRDFGACMASHTSVGLSSVKLGKLNKDGQFTSIREAASVVKRFNAKVSLQVLQVLAWLNDSPFTLKSDGEKVKLVSVEKLTPSALFGDYFAE